MSKIVVSSQGDSLESLVDPRFGRAANFLVIDPATMRFDVLSNSQARGMGQGAGIQAAEMVAKSGAKTVISGIVGPKAWQALRAAGLDVVQEATGSVGEAVKAFIEGRLKVSAEPMGGGW